MFYADRFGRVPVLLLKRLIAIADSEKQQIINAHSISTAKLGTVVVSALGGKASKLDECLPFAVPRNSRQISVETEEAMRWALSNEKMPGQIVAMIGAELKK